MTLPLSDIVISGLNDGVSQLGAAALLAAELAPFILWHSGEKRWYQLDYNSGIWEPKDNSTDIQVDIDDILIEYAPAARCTEAFSSSVTSALSRRLAKSSAEFNGDPWLLGTRNGTVDLRTGYLRAADPAKYVTKRASVKYDDDALCPLWNAHLLRLFEDDDERVSWFQEAIGCALIGDATEKDHIFVYLIGPPGNGKGTAMRAIVNVLGIDQYASNINPLDLVRDRHLAWMHKLKGCRIAIVEEVRAQRMDVSKLKTLTGGDAITANRMRQEDETWRPTHTLFMTANDSPIFDSTSGMERRYRPIQTCNSIPTEELDPTYEDALNIEGEGILAWMIRGCLLWQANGHRLRQLDSIQHTAASHLEENDPFLEWSEECITPSLNAVNFVSRGDAIGSYNWWAAGRSLQPLTNTGQRQMYEWLRAHGGIEAKTNGARGFRGLDIRRG